MYSPEHQSDIDLLLIATGLPTKPIERMKFDLDFLGLEALGVHRIWETPEDLDACVNAHQAFWFEIIRDGIAVYDPEGMFDVYKAKVQDLIAKLGIRETEHAWIWPQKVPGEAMDW
jgi:hypothetical protein